MNLILLPDTANTSEISRSSPLGQHLTKVLKTQPGSLLETGIWMGPRGRSTVREITPSHLILNNDWTLNLPHPPLFPITLIIGCPRPVQARRILRETTSLGVGRLVFVSSDKTEPSYSKSKLWSEHEWLPLLQEGATQAMACHGPEIIPPLPLNDYLKSTPTTPDSLRTHCDLYHNAPSLPELLQSHPNPHALEIFIGPERGWSDRERKQFQSLHILPTHLGPRVLRTETACGTALAQALPSFNSYHPHHNPR